ncbi:Putative metal chaperone YciC [Polystyrenella longa]|uniref:Metal chaperone YciC n=1 Tax=Polystyrenella longa TaxID=2528007 RepID=A0A518CGN4_9PLAN|nr:GTP-binding protein [Polystyrenella longa]QDU78383.1 Putative metal chaperone YciC [Polystyrenella longa]
MTHKIRFIMVGGFLGAGKTTTMAQLARHYQNQGLNVGIVTNDQAAGLVDTESLRSQGFHVGEVAGACFCCQFDNLIETVRDLSKADRPDILLAEPVGSCTDLVATVVQPIKQLLGAEFEIAPYTVILKPSHGSKILKNEQKGGFSPKAAYILKKQLEEADAILINRIDELTPEQTEDLTSLVKRDYPEVPILQMSAKLGTGIDQLIELLDQQGDFGRRILDIDYDIYAEGEAELGWLNSSANLSSEEPYALDELLLAIVRNLQVRINEAGFEAAHLKTIGLWEGFFGVANLISNDTEPEVSLPSNCEVKEVDLIVNARVACDPVILEAEAKLAVGEECAKRGITSTFRTSQSFRPGRPEPTHRVSKSV